MPLEFSVENGRFNGSIKYLLDHYEDISSHIKVKSSSNSKYSNCTLDPSTCDSSFNTAVSSTIPPQWILYEFKKCVIYVKSYSFKSSGTEKDSKYHLRGWKLIASIDGKVWKEIDEQKNTSILNGGEVSVNIECKKGLFRFFKVLQTERGFTNDFGFSIRQFEVFGTLYEEEYVPRVFPCTLKSRYFSFIHTLFAFLIYS